MRYSPLRYPGGKAKLSSFMEVMIDKLNHRGGTYIEPFAGGAGIALDLLFKDYVSHIVINDYDKAIASFWKAIITDNEKFVDKIINIPLNIDEWYLQKSIVESSSKYSFELGFATFYLNRTNRSGIISGGPIGGKKQDGEWTLDARFNRQALAERIIAIGERKKDISVYCKDASSLINNYLPKYGDNALIYFDPPYFYKGKQLYMNYFSISDHERIGELIKNKVKCDWMITYDDAPEIVDIYSEFEIKRYDLNYSVAEKRKASEIIIMPSLEYYPTADELSDKKILLNVR